MPLYEYECAGCGRRFEALARNASDAPPACPSCGARRVRKQFSSFAPMDRPDAGLPSCASGSCSTGMCGGGSCPLGER
jgi:putative FmdB family regulatory protein